MNVKSLPKVVFCFVLGILAFFPWDASAQESKAKFAEYDEKFRQYLERLHGRQGALSWRDDFPGGFSAWQRKAKAKHRELLGLIQIGKDVAGHNPQVVLEKQIKDDGFFRRRGRIETEPGVWIPFWLLTPDAGTNTKRPLVLCCHGHSGDGWNKYAGVYRNESDRKETLAKDGSPGVEAVKRGYVALVPATRGLASETALPDLKNRHGGRQCRAQLIHCLLAGRTAVGERVWDTQRLLDWVLAEVKGIDPTKIVMLGNSGGGVLTVHTAAADERITVAVPSCSFSAFTSQSGFIFHCDCCLIPRASTELAGLADIGALAAPRALLAVHGRKDDLHSYTDVERAMKRVKEIYAAADAKGKFEHRWGGGGHKFYPEIMWPFIESSLRLIQ